MNTRFRGFNRAWSVKVRHNLTETIPLSEKAESYRSGTLYNYGDLPPRYPMPALLVDSMSDLGERWANWIDDDGLNGHRY